MSASSRMASPAFKLTARGGRGGGQSPLRRATRPRARHHHPPGLLLGNTAAYRVCTTAAASERLSRTLRVSLMIFWGRWGLPVPFRTPISFVFGTPIKPSAAPLAAARDIGQPSTELPPSLSQQAVDTLHRELLTEVRRIYDECAPSYGWVGRPIRFV